METASLGSSNYSSPLSSYHGSGYVFQSAETESRVLSRTGSAASHHSTHSGSYLTDKERRVYAVHGSESHSTEESGAGRLVGSQGSSRFSNVPPARTVLTHSEIHGPPSMNLEAKNRSTEESGAGHTGRMVGSQGSLRFSNVPPAHTVLTHSEIHGPPSMNLEAKNCSTEESGAGHTGRMVGSQGSLRFSNSPARTVLTHSEVHGPPSMNLPIEQQPSTRPPSDVYPGPDVPPYIRAHREETYSQPREPTGGKNGEHRTSSGNLVYQASSQSNIAVENFRDPEPRNYIYQQPFLSTNSDQFVSGLRPSSFGSSLGSSIFVAGTGTSYPSGTSLATSDLLSSESSGPGSSYQGSTMPSQPSFEPSLSSVEEEQSEEEREEEEETWVKTPKLAKSASSTKQRKSSPPAEEHKEQTKSWASSLLGLPKKVVSGMWSTLSGSTEKKKEEDSDSSFESCKDDEGSSSD